MYSFYIDICTVLILQINTEPYKNNVKINQEFLTFTNVNLEMCDITSPQTLHVFFKSNGSPFN